MNKQQLKFIAGAICPKCKALDRIAVTYDDEKIICVSCDFEELKPKNPQKKTKLQSFKSLGILLLNFPLNSPRTKL